MSHTIDNARIDSAIGLIKQFVKEESTLPLIAALEALKQDPDSEAHLSALSETFNNLGITQGAVLTYAPYVSVLLSDDPFGN